MGGVLAEADGWSVLERDSVSGNACEERPLGKR